MRVGLNYARIIAAASAVPGRIVTNDDLAGLMETSDEWISTRTGIKRRGDWLLVGFGLNFGTAAFPAELASKAASLLPGAKLDQDLVQGACQAIEKAAVSVKNGAFLDRYRRLCFLQGRQVKIKLGYGELQRQCLDIDDQGRLLLNTPAGVKAVASGEVTKVDL